MQWQAAGLVSYFGFLEYISRTNWAEVGLGAMLLAPAVAGFILRAGAPEEGENQLGPWSERVVRWVLIPLWLAQMSHQVFEMNGRQTYFVFRPENNLSQSFLACHGPWIVLFVVAGAWQVRGPQWIAKAAAGIVFAAPLAYWAEMPKVWADVAKRPDLLGFVPLVERILLWFFPMVFLGGRANISAGCLTVACLIACFTTELGLAAGAVFPKMAGFYGAAIGGTEKLREGKAFLLLLASIPLIRCLGTWTGDCFGPYRRWYLIALIAVGMVFLPHPLNDSYMFPTAAAFPSLFGALAAARWRRVVSAPLRVGLSWLIGLTVTILSYAMHGKDPAPLLSFAAAFAAGSVLHSRRERQQVAYLPVD
ncbi:MAG: hypothetical protein FJW30_03255 [Acidobacteria bacterium]|nr:hypothetical protein [Acidobacteriota bacterium]